MEGKSVSLRRLAASGLRLLTGDPVPLFASLEITLKCNGSCVYCGSSDAAGDGSGELSTAEWLSVIDDLADSGCLAISLTGGEPLTRPDVEQIAERAFRHGIAVGLNTNGRLLRDRRSVLSYLKAVTVSLDGVREVHDSLRGPGAFDAAVDAIAVAREHGIDVSVTAVLSAAAVEGLDDFLELLRCLSVPVTFQPQYPVRLRTRDKPAALPPDAAVLMKAVEKIRNAAESGVIVRNTKRGMVFLFGNADGIRPPLNCLGGRLFVRVAADGSVQVCGLPNDPCFSDGGSAGFAPVAPAVPKRLDVRDGVVFCMKKTGWPFVCGGCLSAARVELNGLLTAGPGTMPR